MPRRDRSVGAVAGDGAAAAAGGRASGWWPECLDGFAGVSSNGLFDLAKSTWVDIRKPAGMTSQTAQLGLENTLKVIFTLRYFIWSPNLVWFAMAFGLHTLYPYNLAAAEKGFAVGWAFERFCVNYIVAFSYYAFFHVNLYINDWSKRKYQPGVYPTAGNMLHNLWYWSLAIVQWTLWECVMTRLWAAGVVPYKTNAEVLGDPWLLGVNVAWVLVIPLWRDLHFYIAHRFIHIRAVYKYVHSLHHRNADPEPFSGMTMHPVEHLYYFSNAFTPSLYLPLSPLIFLWNFIHLTIAPGAGHSGWEDHFQADQYHYLHHAKFECNYGSPLSAPIDQLLGTFREKLGSSDQYKGEWGEKTVRQQEIAESMPGKQGVWSPEGYLGMPKSWDHFVYTIYWVALFPLAWWGLAANTGADRVHEISGWPIEEVLAVTVAYSPVALAMLLCVASGDKMSWRWPFHKEMVIGPFGVGITAGFFGCMLPMYHTTKWAAALTANGA